jgi:hypothetical protein
LNGWLESAEPKGQPPIPQLIHHYPGYLWRRDQKDDFEETNIPNCI